MAVPASFTPAAAPTASRPPVTPGTVQPTPQLFESPTFAPQRPATPPVATKPATQPATTTNKPANASKPNKKLLFGGIFLIILVVLGLGVGLMLVREPQDVRQQASTPTGTSRIFMTPETGSFTAGSAQKIQIKVNIGGATKIDGIQFVANFSNTLPANIAFKPADIDGLRLIVNSLSDTEDGKKLTIAFVTTPPTPFTGTTTDLLVGELEFTTPGEGQMSVTFDPTLSKIIQNQTTDDVLRTPASYTYTFTGGATSPTPTPTASTVANATASASPTASASASPTLSPGITPSPTATGSAQPTSSPTPTTSGGVGGTNGTPTPTPQYDDEGRLITQPTSTQDQPVSGSAEMTLLLLVLGTGMISLGFIFNQKITYPD